MSLPSMAPKYLNPNDSKREPLRNTAIFVLNMTFWTQRRRLVEPMASQTWFLMRLYVSEVDILRR